jgi:hypothetical protein
MDMEMLMALAGLFLLPGAASAQLQIVAQRCGIENLDPAQATARMEWMRRCALLKGPPIYYDTGVSASNGGTLHDYVEAGADNNWAGVNMYTFQSQGYEINSAYLSALYGSGQTIQGIDADGFYKWWNNSNRKKARPSYPIYGSEYDLAHPYNRQLFPHPTLANCGFYLDKNGTQPATGYSFYLNAFCETSSSFLNSGVPIGFLSGTWGTTQYYTLQVPPGATNVIFETSGGSGDADLYVRYGAAPDTATYDCRPYWGGNFETCTFSSPAAGTWHVMVRAYSDYSGVTLKGTINQLFDGVATPAVSGAYNSEQRWTMEVPPGMSRVTFTLAGIAGNTGDADLYVKNGSSPTTTVFDCRPYIGGNSEVCSFDYPSAGTWHVMVRGWNAYSGVTVTGDYY